MLLRGHHIGQLSHRLPYARRIVTHVGWLRRAVLGPGPDCNGHHGTVQHGYGGAVPATVKLHDEEDEAPKVA
ncbi:hypothetical protein GCM10027360_10610 [Amycolatopsis echigonensis]